MGIEITEELKNHPLYKYYELPIKPVPEDVAAKIMSLKYDNEDGLNIADINRMFDDGYLPCEFGLFKCPDGGSIMANLTDMPGVTPEMFDWWFAWHGLAPMRYKIWNHEDHYYVMTRNPEISSNKALSMKERYWNTIHDVQEDVGLGLEHIAINFRNPADIGFDQDFLGHDGGETWSKVTLTDLPNNNSGIDAVTLSDGRHVLIYNPVSVKAGKEMGPRTPLAIAVSNDGENWYKITEMGETSDSQGELSYPAIIQGANGHLYFTDTRLRQDIFFMEFTLKETPTELLKSHVF